MAPSSPASSPTSTIPSAGARISTSIFAHCPAATGTFRRDRWLCAISTSEQARELERAACRKAPCKLTRRTSYLRARRARTAPKNQGTVSSFYERTVPPCELLDLAQLPSRLYHPAQ